MSIRDIKTPLTPRMDVSRCRNLRGRSVDILGLDLRGRSVGAPWALPMFVVAAWREYGKHDKMKQLSTGNCDLLGRHI